MNAKQDGRKGALPPVYIVSGGSGASGQQIVETALAQFPTVPVPVIVRSKVRSLGQVEAAVRKAGADGGTVVHTLVDGGLREALARLGRKHGVVTIDLMGQILEQVSAKTGEKPLGQPGLYRNLRKDYFDRVDAIDYAVAHDDGNRVGDLPSADVEKVKRDLLAQQVVLEEFGGTRVPWEKRDLLRHHPDKLADALCRIYAGLMPQKA
mgnify:CR=1 FL=1